jgi:hypothetical protein
MYESALLLRDLLASNGSIYVHLEPDVGNHVRVILDEVFGEGCMRTEIAWRRTSSHGNMSRAFGETWECIYYYTKSPDEWVWNQQYVLFDPTYFESHFTGKAEFSRDLDRGHAVHFRCVRDDVAGLRLDLMTRPPRLPDLDAVWRRHVVVDLEVGPVSVVALEDLVATKKTQRDRDWATIGEECYAPLRTELEQMRHDHRRPGSS